MTEKLLTKETVRQILGVSYTTLHRLIIRGHLPIVRVSDRVRITETSLRDFLETRTERRRPLTIAGDSVE